jgi:nitrile hydratase subunit beta
MASVHDLGQIEPFASRPIDRHEHAPSDFDKSVDAMLYLLSGPERRLIGLDELRRAIEALPEAEYHALSYYEKWLIAMCDLLIEKGVIAERELDAKLTELTR